MAEGGKSTAHGGEHDHARHDAQHDHDTAAGGARATEAMALSFLRGEIGASPLVMVGLNQALLDPVLVAMVLTASQRGAKMAAHQPRKAGRSVRDVVLDPTFEWAPPAAAAAGGSGGTGGGQRGGAATGAQPAQEGDKEHAAPAGGGVQTGQSGAGAVDPHASVDQLPAGGEAVSKVGVVGWDKSPPLRLRSSASTDVDNVITALPFNTHLQVVKRMPGDWLFVSTPDGKLGYVAATYVKTDLPEPGARIHRVQSGLHGFAISIAEQYYHQYADNWGQDLRFYVNVLAWVNKKPVPDSYDGWKSVAFDAGDLIWVPTHDFAYGLKGVVNSGSISHNIADAVGVADFLDRVGELWDDFRRALDKSLTYLPGALARHAEAAIVDTLVSMAEMLIAAGAIIAISTAVGAAIGALAGGVGAAPGAAVGFDVGMALVDWLGLGFLAQFIIQSMAQLGKAFGAFLGDVWDAHGMEKAADLAGRHFAEALGTLVGILLSAIVALVAMEGLGEVMGKLGESRFFRGLDITKFGDWLRRQAENKGEEGTQSGGGEGGGGKGGGGGGDHGKGGGGGGEHGKGGGGEHGKGGGGGGEGEHGKGGGGDKGKGGGDKGKGGGSEGEHGKGGGGDKGKGGGSEGEHGKGEHHKGKGGEHDKGKGDEHDKGKGDEHDKGKGGEHDKGKGGEHDKDSGGGKERGPGDPALTPELRAKRASLRDDRAVTVFDEMFDGMGKDPAKMQRALDGIEKKAAKTGKTLEDALNERYEREHPQKKPPSAELLEQLKGLADRVSRLESEVDAYETANPSVKGTARWKSRLGDIRERIDKLSSDGDVANEHSVRGEANNLDGLEGELRTAREASRVKAVNADGAFKTTDGTLIDIDVVAEDGKSWIESKSVEPFRKQRGVDRPSNWDNMEKQAAKQLDAAKNNPIDGQPPTVTFRFHKGVSIEVAGALESMGIKVEGTRVDMSTRGGTP